MPGRPYFWPHIGFAIEVLRFLSSTLAETQCFVPSPTEGLLEM
jgi:hypothetical protein